MSCARSSPAGGSLTKAPRRPCCCPSGLAPELKPEVERLLELKVNSPEIRMIPQIRTLNEYLSSSIAEIEQKIARLPNEREIGWEELNELFLSQLI